MSKDMAVIKRRHHSEMDYSEEELNKSAVRDRSKSLSSRSVASASHSLNFNSSKIESLSLSSDWSMEQPPKIGEAESEETRSMMHMWVPSPEESYMSMTSTPSADVAFDPGEASRVPAEESTPQYAAAGDVACNKCQGRKFKACKACLTCAAAFCQLHVRDHYGKPALQRHVLVEVTENVSLVQENAQLKQMIQLLRDEIATLKQNSSKLKLPEYICKGKRPVPVDVILDPSTAHRALLVSADRKRVRRGEQRGSIHQSGQRFDGWTCVLATDGFSTGRYCWHTKVNHEFTIGVSKQSAARKGRFTFSPSQGYWCLYHYRSSFTVLNEHNPSLRAQAVPRVLGVCVDVDERWVTFYNAETKAPIYTFEAMTFLEGEKIYPVFSTSERSLDLEITTVMS